jgi:hypothetical protein
MNTDKQSVFTIHQMHLSAEGQILLQGRGWGSAETDLEIGAYANKSGGAKRFIAAFWQFYSPAKKVTAGSLNEVFAAGNGYGPLADQVENLGVAYSCSVGDIIQCGGLYWMVDPCGFTDVTDTVIEGKKLIT